MIATTVFVIQIGEVGGSGLRLHRLLFQHCHILNPGNKLYHILWFQTFTRFKVLCYNGIAPN